MREFVRLSYNVYDLLEVFLTSCFISGLRESMKLELFSRCSNSILEAMRLARLEEEKVTLTRKTLKNPCSCNMESWEGNFTFSSPTNKGANSCGPVSFTPMDQQVSLPSKGREICERRKNGLCFHYNEKNTVGQHCKSKKTFQY